MSETITLTKDKLKEIMRECFNYGALDSVFHFEYFPHRIASINNFYDRILKDLDTEQ